MGTKDRTPTSRLSAEAAAGNGQTSLPSFWEKVVRTPYAYDLYYLLRWLDAKAGHKIRLGRAHHPREEPLRIGQEPSLAFAPSTLSKAQSATGERPPRVSILSFGLFGPNGPLPLHLTEYARERARNHGDSTLAAFADLFHHRLILLFYRAWADAQATVSLDRGTEARFDAYLSSLIQLGQPSLRERDCLGDHAKYFMTGHLVRQTRNPEGLCQILRQDLGVPVAIIEHLPGWIEVDADQRTRLGGRKPRRRLAMGAIIGIAVRDAQYKFQIILGPLSRPQYLTLLPGAPQTQRLVAWVRNYIGIELSWEVKLVLNRHEVEGNVLGRKQQLGWGSWLGQRTSPTDADDLVYRPEAYLDHKRAQATHASAAKEASAW